MGNTQISYLVTLANKSYMNNLEKPCLDGENAPQSNALYGET